MIHFFAVMLWVAGLLAIIAGMMELGIAIFIIILINGAFAFLQEYKTEKSALNSLRKPYPNRNSQENRRRQAVLVPAAVQTLAWHVLAVYLKKSLSVCSVTSPTPKLH